MLDALAQAGRLSVSGLSCYRGPIGTLLWDDRPRPVKAILTGISSGGYTWEYAAKPDGGAYSGFVAGQGIAYEANGATGLVGMVVTLWPSEAADWRFQYVKSGAPNCKGKHNELVFRLTGCFLPVPGASVQFIAGGVTVYSGTTDGGGGVVISEPLPNTYTINWSFNCYSGSTSATITAACSNATASVDLLSVAAPGSQCCEGCIYPLPGSLHITTVAGTFPLTLVFGSDPTRWSTEGGSTYSCGGTEYFFTITVDCTGGVSLFWLGSPCNCADSINPITVAFPCSCTFGTISGTFPATGVNGCPNPLAGGFTIGL
jgi:hypothetical protein